MRIPANHQRPYALGVALSGGGARGFAHIGALRALAEEGLVPDIIAGVSAGSVVAAFYASGLLNGPGPDPLLRLFSTGKFSDFAEMHVPRQSFFSLDRFQAHLEKLLPYQSIEQLPVKTVIGAVDLDAGTKVAFTSGPLAERIVASCSMPIVFDPKEIDGRRYVDGGVLRNLPAWPIRHLCRRLIGINCSPMYKMPPARSILDIARRSYALMSKNNTTADMELCDLVINLTETADHQVFDLRSLAALEQAGYETARAALRPQ